MSKKRTISRKIGGFNPRVKWLTADPQWHPENSWWWSIISDGCHVLWL